MSLEKRNDEQEFSVNYGSGKKARVIYRMKWDKQIGLEESVEICLFESNRSESIGYKLVLQDPLDRNYDNVVKSHEKQKELTSQDLIRELKMLPEHLRWLIPELGEKPPWHKYLPKQNSS